MLSMFQPVERSSLTVRQPKDIGKFLVSYLQAIPYFSIEWREIVQSSDPGCPYLSSDTSLVMGEMKTLGFEPSSNVACASSDYHNFSTPFFFFGS